MRTFRSARFNVLFRFFVFSWLSLARLQARTTPSPTARPFLLSKERSVKVE
jgi:hypothetical protein